MDASTKTDNPRFVVGVDFGTTYTSVAFCHSSNPEGVKLVQTWPNNSTGNSSADQVPTEIYYTNPRARTKLWGYEIPKDGKDAPEPLKWFKLLLQERLPPSPPATTGSRVSAGCPLELSSLSKALRDSHEDDYFVPPTTTPAEKTAQQIQKLGISPLSVVTDFLASVRKVTIASIERTYKAKWVRESKIEYVLTVPAIWSDTAKDSMVQAVQNAGFGKHRKDFNLVSEPESAAAYILSAIRPSCVGKGDTFTFCDAGGGTVDLISYKITSFNPLRLDEVVRGTGDFSGSVFLNERFEKYIRRTLGDGTIDRMKPRSRNEMMRAWEEKIKFKFGNSTNVDDFELVEGFEVNVPGVPDDHEKNLEDGFHIMKVEEVQKIFDPVVDRIVNLVKEQVRDVEKNGQRVAVILLVGGFGFSEYLLKRLQGAKYGGKKLEVLQPMNSRSAIARGALLRGLDGFIVQQRIARRFYGSMSCCDFEAGKGWDHKKFWCSKEEVWNVPGSMNWYIKRNQVIDNTFSTMPDFYFLKDVNAPTVGSFAFETYLYACDVDNAPDFEWKRPHDVYRVCALCIDLSSIPRGNFQRRSNSAGQEFYFISFQLKTTVVDEVLKFEFLFRGKTYGTVTAKFE